MAILRRLGIGLALAVGAIALVAFVARFGDGPLGPFPGGELRQGELVSEPVADWSFARDVPEIALQLVAPHRSRTTWILVHEGQAYIPCGFMSVPLFKQWPYQANVDGRAVVRVEGRRYLARLVQVTDPGLTATLARIGAEKYDLPGYETSPDSGSTWYFRLEPRGHGG